jgi:nucleoside-diphosphate-sugar epimerase
VQIAILGATSQIAKDLVCSFSKQTEAALTLFARRPEAVVQWLGEVGLAGRYAAADIATFGEVNGCNGDFDAVINFVGVGNPAQTAAMGASILDITQHYDGQVLSYIRSHPACRYLFLSSGAAYGASFDEPASIDTKATVAINNLQMQDWYAVAKLYAECRHRAQPDLPIIDIRVFNYFSCTQDLDARFLMTDILRAIRDKTVLRTSGESIVRDFIHPDDFFQLVSLLLSAPPKNVAVDCYSAAPIEKFALLQAMQQEFDLQFETVQTAAGVNATGAKPHYYSMNKRAADFGYIPKLNALESVQKEVRAVLTNLWH